MDNINFVRVISNSGHAIRRSIIFLSLTLGTILLSGADILFVLILYVIINNFSVMSDGQSSYACAILERGIMWIICAN